MIYVLYHLATCGGFEWLCYRQSPSPPPPPPPPPKEHLFNVSFGYVLQVTADSTSFLSEMPQLMKRSSYTSHWLSQVQRDVRAVEP